jgi:hypothetical protein
MNKFRKDPGHAKNDIAKAKRSAFSGYSFVATSCNADGMNNGTKKAAFVTGVAVSPDGNEEIRISFDIADCRGRSAADADCIEQVGEEYAFNSAGLLLHCDGEVYTFTKA